MIEMGFLFHRMMGDVSLFSFPDFNHVLFQALQHFEKSAFLNVWQIYHRITEYPVLEGTHRDHWVQLLELILIYIYIELLQECRCAGSSVRELWRGSWLSEGHTGCSAAKPLKARPVHLSEEFLCWDSAQLSSSLTVNEWMQPTCCHAS